MPATELLMITVAVPDPRATAKAWCEASEFVVLADEPVPELDRLWGLRRGDAATVLTGVSGVDTRYLRFVASAVPGPAGPPLQGVGPTAVEFFSSDVDELHRRFAANPEFRPRTEPTTYDMSHMGAATARSMHVLGPAGLHMYFTTLLAVPPPRVMPVVGQLVAPPVNILTLGGDREATGRLYSGALGIPPRFAGRLADPVINALMEAPADWAVEDVVFSVGDGQLLEHHFPLGDPVPGRRIAGTDLPTGPIANTLRVTGFDAALAAARAVGCAVSAPEVLSAAPYGGRRVAAVAAPSGERAELVEA
jgi:hypothetical protein